ncbi:glycosyltransferase [Marseilla massiliensis]|uniref:glycosyltransferase n=1 Tax=Marseilla massiliensis TaxID=1841864 RepID=UPI001EF6EE69|nr:glycosyltransferase [Marseilla massiliensis]
MKTIDVSIVIVCMNNLKNLYPCLNSILKNTTVNYEVFVVAFLFSDENLQKLRSDYPTINIIISDKLRGFSENNNIALKQAVGKYCFIVNDDTYFSDHVIDNLVEDFNKVNDDVAIISPVTLNVDGSVQRCGKPKYNLFTYLLYWMKLVGIYENKSKYTNGKGLFQTYNISGACFLIKTDIFKNIGWFDERYYFCPEDIALSTVLNENGYKCYVDSTIRLTHTGGGSWSKTMYATKPAQIKGEIIFYGQKSLFHKIAVRLILLIFLPIYSLLWKIFYMFRKNEKSKIFCRAYLNGIKAILTRKTPKELFIQFYKNNKNA